VRVLDAPGPWQWGDRVGVLETLVVDDEARGAGVGQALVGTVRERLAGSGVQVMKVSVVAGNDGAVRFYERKGAVDFTKTLVMPVVSEPVRLGETA
jgi:GNAT superfamily N-acetyltransferase